MDSNLERLNEIKQKIRTINPEITDKLLELLYEYFKVCYFDELITELKNPEFQKRINEATKNILVTK